MARVKVRNATYDDLNDFFAKMQKQVSDDKYSVEKWQDKKNIKVLHKDYLPPQEAEGYIKEDYFPGYELLSSRPDFIKQGLRIHFKDTYFDYNDLFGLLTKDSDKNLEINRMQDEDNIRILHTKMKLIQEKSPKDFIPFDDDYNLLINRPKINGIELIGDKPMEEFGAYAYDDTEVRELISERQEKLIPGDNVFIVDNVISAEVTSAVNTVNGHVGDVELTAGDVNAVDQDNEFTNMDLERLLR